MNNYQLAVAHKNLYMKKVIIFYIILFPMILLSQEYKNIGGKEGVIFPKGVKSSFSISSQTFTPTNSQIEKFENRIDTSYNEYVRQYFGVIYGKHKKICVTLIHKDALKLHKKWKKEPVIVFGGGKNYRAVTYDIVRDKITSNTENSVE